MEAKGFMLAVRWTLCFRIALFLDELGRRVEIAAGNDEDTEVAI